MYSSVTWVFTCDLFMLLFCFVSNIHILSETITPSPAVRVHHLSYQHLHQLHHQCHHEKNHILVFSTHVYFIIQQEKGMINYFNNRLSIIHINLALQHVFSVLKSQPQSKLILKMFQPMKQMKPMKKPMKDPGFCLEEDDMMKFCILGTSLQSKVEEAEYRCQGKSWGKFFFSFSFWHKFLLISFFICQMFS